MASESLPERRTPLFPLGQTVATPAALRLLAWFEVTPAQLLDRHITGDWGLLFAPRTAKKNELTLREGLRLLSSYPVCGCTDNHCNSKTLAKADQRRSGAWEPAKLDIARPSPRRLSAERA
jgi:hypothetical protein